MASNGCKVPIVVILLLAASRIPALSASSVDGNSSTLRPGDELRRYRRIRARLSMLNKPSAKTIQSPDGDLIDCVPSHLQPAFDHPRLQGMRPMLIFVGSTACRIRRRDPGGHEFDAAADDTFQLWRASGDSCPEGTVPIRRVTEKDIMRASSVKRFGRKPVARTRRDSENTAQHEHAVGYVVGGEYYGAKASLNVWAPKVTSNNEFSLSQMWIISGSFGSDLNTIEAGWQVSPRMYGDNSPRFFTYWTSDAYQATGCYNLLCSGFIQTSNKIAVGAAISPTSTYKSRQFDISILVWKDPKHGNWWLEFGKGQLVGYWPSSLFSHLAEHASMVQFGGEVVNTQPRGAHTSTEMGSGHYPGEGFGRSAYFRNLQVVDWDNSLLPASNLRVLADHPNCYDIQGWANSAWGNYFYYGGPGRSTRCP